MKEETYRRPTAGDHPPNLSPEYKSTTGRAPTKPAIILPHSLSEITGPLLASERLDAHENDLTRQRMASRSASASSSGPRARRGRQARPQRAGRDLAVQRRGPLQPCRRPSRCAARSEFPGGGRRADAGAATGSSPSARSISLAQPPQRLAAGAHPLLPVRPGLRQRLVTQMYFPGDPLLGSTPSTTRCRPERASAWASFDMPVPPEFALGYRFDIVLRGRDATPMKTRCPTP